MRLFFSTHRRPVSTFVALSQGLQKAYPVPDELPELNCSGIRTVRVFYQQDATAARAQ